MLPLNVRSADTAITIEPIVILAKARSRLAPPAAISSRTDPIMGANGVRSKVKLMMFIGVLTNGMITLAKGILFLTFSTDCPAFPSLLVKV